MVGSSFAHYRITGKLGEGGMGEVYRATDGRLNREVAVKVLSEAVSADPSRLARFAREAQLLASLSHPNIGQVYGVEEERGRSAIILELIEGETLADRIARGPAPPAEVHRIALQIADALEAAHRKGIVHRDLKPANVKITPDGTVKVLDFGLAKSLEEEPASLDPQRSPTLTAHATQAGVLMGTAGYMAPEQAKGARVDERADVWAFGVVLFELLTGRELFAAPSVPETLANVLTRAPSFDELPAETPAALRRVLRLCLVRDPKQRLHDVADARILLQDQDAGERSAVAAPAQRARVRPWMWVAGIAAALFLAALMGKEDDSSIPAPRRYSISLHAGPELVVGVGSLITFTPDGRSLVFAARESGKRSLYRRDLASGDLAPIPGTENGDSPFFSPDGKWLGFTAAGRFVKVPAEGGRPIVLAESSATGGAAWLADGTLVYAPIYSEGLFRVPSNGAAAERLTTPDRARGELGHWWPCPLPDEKRVLFTAFRTPVDTSRIGVLDLASGAIEWVVDGGFFGRYVSTGHLLYARGQRVYALPFDARKLVATGPAVPVLDDVFLSQTAGFAAVTVASNGALAYISATIGTPARELIWIDRSGRVTPALSERRRYMSVSLSPDGRDAALSVQGDSRDLWTYSFERGTLSRLTTGPATEFDARWSHDGRELFYVLDRPPFTLFRIGIGQPDSGRPVWKEPGEVDASNPAVSPDGRTLGFTLTERETGQNLYTRPVGGDGQPHPVRATQSEERHIAFSPDGRFVAYQSDDTGRAEIYAEPFPGEGQRVQVSADGGTEPVWAPNGEIFYRHGDEFRAVVTRSSPRFEFDPPRTLFTHGVLVASAEDSRTWDVARDGARILAISIPEVDRPRQIELVTDWTAALPQLAPPESR